MFDCTPVEDGWQNKPMAGADYLATGPPRSLGRITGPKPYRFHQSRSSDEQEISVKEIFEKNELLNSTLKNESTHWHPLAKKEIRVSPREPASLERVFGMCRHEN